MSSTTTNKLRFSRRSLLKASSLGPMASLLLPELRNPAYAQNAVPKNLVVLYTYHGTWSEMWASGTGTGFQLGPLLAPLADFKNDLLLVKNLKMRSSELFPPTDNSSGHTQGAIHSTTSFKPVSDIYAGSPAIPGDESFDQAILRNLIAKNGGKPLTEIESLNLAMMNSAFAPTGQMLGRISYKRKPAGSTGVQILSPIQDPSAAWYKLFSTYTGGGTTPVPTPGGTEDPARTKARLMAKFANGQYGAMANKVKDIYGLKTKERLDAHAEYMSALEKSLAPIQTTPGDPPVIVPSGNCTVPPRSEFPMKPTTPSGWWPILSENMPRLTHLALACGRTRVIGLQIEDSFSAGVHDKVHAGDKAGTTEYHLELARQTAKILKMLKDTPTADGKNLLYNSAVVWIGELGNGQAHSQDGLHWMTAGNAGGSITPGRLIDTAGRSHADWFVAIGQAMGADNMTTFGEPRAFGGVLPGLKA